MANEDKPVVIDRPVVRDEEKIDQPKMYSVILLNDAYTPAETVSDILHSVFGLSAETAWEKMVSAHKGGASNVGTFTKDVAETKISQALVMAQGYPLAFDLQEAA